MSKVLMLVGLAFALSLPAYTQTKVGTAADEAAILKNRDAQNAAYNRHDGKAYAALMTIDADRVDAASFRGPVDGHFEVSIGRQWVAAPKTDACVTHVTGPSNAPP